MATKHHKIVADAYYGYKMFLLLESKIVTHVFGTDIVSADPKFANMIFVKVILVTIQK